MDNPLPGFSEDQPSRNLKPLSGVIMKNTKRFAASLLAFTFL
jgi:hypothetical protein